MKTDEELWQEVETQEYACACSNIKSIKINENIRISTAKMIKEGVLRRYMHKETWIFSNDKKIESRQYMHYSNDWNIVRNDEYCLRFHDKLVYRLKKILNIRS